MIPFEFIFKATSEEDADRRITEISKQHPELVFVYPSVFGKIFMYGFPTRSAIRAAYYEPHLQQGNKSYMKNGEPVEPTRAQIARVNQCAYIRD